MKEVKMKNSMKVAFSAVAIATAATLTGCSTNFYEKQQKQVLENNDKTFSDCKENQAIMRASGKGGFEKKDPCFTVLYGGFTN